MSSPNGARDTICVEISPEVLDLAISIEKLVEKCCSSCYNEAEGSSPVSGPEPAHLDNQIAQVSLPISERNPEMATKINQSIMVNGVKVWLRANSMQEFADKLIQLVGTPQVTPPATPKHLFSDFAWTWFNTYSKPNIQAATAETYKRQLTLHLIPAFQDMMVEDITTDDVQRLFNGMEGAKTTKAKARMVLNQILDTAVEDKMIPENPAKSKRVKVTGKASQLTPLYSEEQMIYLIQHIQDVRSPVDRAYLALQALHPLRLEEVLGLAPEDVDMNDMSISVQRAMTHPDRNQPETKPPKTESSRRVLGLSPLALPYLPDDATGPFLLGGDKPLSYTQVRKMCQRIQRDTGFNEKITPSRFRPTVLTDLYHQTKDVKLTQAAAGHTTPTMTMRVYVRGRQTPAEAVAAIERAYAPEKLQKSCSAEIPQSLAPQALAGQKNPEKLQISCKLPPS